MNKSDSEIWKTHPEFDFIQGSNLGRVRTVDREVSNGKGVYVKKGRILKQQLDNRGYLYVNFGDNGKFINRKVHRIIAQAFLPNPSQLPQVNHKNCRRDDNRVENLEWCDASYNQKYREKYGVSNTEAQGNPVFAVNLKTLEVIRFRSQNEAGRVLGINGGGISDVIKGKQKTAGGYWFTEDGDRAAKITKSELHDIVTGKTSKCPVFAINLETLEVSKFPSQHEAARQLGISQSSIYKVIKVKRKKTHGYWFTNADNNAVEVTRARFGDEVAHKVEQLMSEKEL